jgi:hypothetical protein
MKATREKLVNVEGHARGGPMAGEDIAVQWTMYNWIGDLSSTSIAPVVKTRATASQPRQNFRDRSSRTMRMIEDQPPVRPPHHG